VHQDGVLGTLALGGISGTAWVSDSTLAIASPQQAQLLDVASAKVVRRVNTQSPGTVVARVSPSKGEPLLAVGTAHGLVEVCVSYQCVCARALTLPA
jgi:hypothetical protein